MRIRHTEQPRAEHTAESEQDAIELRSELDELLRARQYADQRERRLADAVRALPERQRPDAELLRQLTRARTLREEIGARCLELSEQLLDVEQRLRQPAPRRAAPGPGPAPQPDTDARFWGAYDDPFAPSAPQPAPPPATDTPPGTDTRPENAQSRSGSTQARPEEPAARAAPSPPPAPKPPRRRSPGELAALAERIATLHHRGAARESAALLDQAAALLLPPDTARLAALLIRSGPDGASVRLARGAADGEPEQAAATLAELRQAGLAEEATELFHALWGLPVDTLPALLAALEQTGQPADGATLLWHWGSAPTAELSALAAALERAGRTGDVRTLLRQAAGRPTADLAALVGTLPAPLPTALLHELAALRPSTELVRLASALKDRRELYDGLLAALTADEGRHRTTLAALRTAGLPTTPAARPRSRWGRRRADGAAQATEPPPGR
ncbi:hypothetical protein ACF9IK_24670 [Kitasatospora hibisci]|uniref:hypothetical protein n=1 Tax=Kitasatospora hibisci TaxID=3369522 RepID=UPI00375468D7